MPHRKSGHDHATNRRPVIEHWLDLTLLPAAPDVAGLWDLDFLYSINGSGHLVAASVLTTAVARLVAPGVLEQHKYKVTVVVDSITGTGFNLRVGAQTLGNGQVLLSTAGTHEFIITGLRGNDVSFHNADAGTASMTVSYLRIEALDPTDIDRIALSDLPIGL